ncbi:MAG: class I SAM-dependent methyltransferase [Phycisphaerae bacterium]|nr:class I SAM-dependent methyltransferase [Phycisphaerae bacterium]
MDFYNSIADSYDAMTNLASRQEQITANVAKLNDRYHPQTLLDIPCGTGYFAISWASHNIEVTGVDCSEKMLQIARKNTQKSVKIDWICAKMEHFVPVAACHFDMICCLGNSIPHLLDDISLDATINNFVQMLNKNGTILIHMLNFPLILSQKNRIVAITRNQNTEFIRFYDFLHSQISFNLLKIDWDGQKSTHNLTSTILNPLHHKDLTTRLQTAGITNIKLYSDLNFNSFDPDTSQSVIIQAQK